MIPRLITLLDLMTGSDRWCALSSGADFWNFVASADVYEQLLDIFQDAGSELRQEIDDRFAELKAGRPD